MKIVLDAMGGDFGPAPNVEAAVQVAREFGCEIALVGRQEQIRPLLVQHNTANLHLPIVHASEVIEMHDHPAQAVRAKKNSSMVVGMQMLARGDADAFVTMGHTGGALAAALLHLGRIQGIHRPCLSTAFPTVKGWVLLCDLGANVDCKPEWLVQFALMGSIYAERVMQIRSPRVGLISNGEEETKGTQAVQEAHALLKQAPLNFIGNVQGYDLPLGNADVFVTDGFTGNVIVKFAEGMKTMIEELLRAAFMTNLQTKVAGALAKNAIRQLMKQRLDYEEIGGAPLLGVDGVVIIGHGRSKARAIRSALIRAIETVERRVVDAIEDGLRNLPQNAAPVEHRG
ncbi:MAG: phosphate acyltransferase PlsX [Anaerolineae bacterium]|nr:phosphate acyltransferase PlsX [Thermoflexales bacterium]MDW8395517.1 phosphate acyltransferase PlsX [Anaerolineae bacterium]